MNAAMGLAVLPYVNNLIDARRKISHLYDTILCNANVRKPTLREEIEHNYIYYPIVFSTEADLLKVIEELNKQEIFPRRYFYPSLNNLPYVRNQQMPVSEEVSRTVLCLPLFVELGEEVVTKIGEVVRDNLR